MRIFLVRHGMSRANLDWKENQRVADHAIELAEEGHEQAREVGEFLAEYFTALLGGFGDGHRHIPDIRLWHSPYMRTRQTAAGIESTCVLPDRGAEYRISRGSSTSSLMWVNRMPGDSWFMDKREHLLLAEQQFGIFDGLSDEERAANYPDMHAYYEKCKRYEGKLWPKMPLGESRFEVCQRVHQAFGTFHRDALKHGMPPTTGLGISERLFAFLANKPMREAQIFPLMKPKK